MMHTGIYCIRQPNPGEFEPAQLAIVDADIADTLRHDAGMGRLSSGRLPMMVMPEMLASAESFI